MEENNYMESIADILSLSNKKNNFQDTLNKYSVDETQILNSIKSKYPALSPYNYRIRLSQEKGIGQYGGGLEFFSPDEPTNPFKGNPTIEVYDPTLKGKALETAIFGDMLHYLPKVDPQYMQYKQKFISSLTPEQATFSYNRYLEDKKNRGEKRSYKDWFDRSWSDGLIRGYIAPDVNDEFRKQKVYTPQQEEILNQIISYLQQKQ